jgi:hypothetical protein
MPPLGRRQARHSKHGVFVCGFFRHWLTYIPVRNNLATLHPKNIHVGSATVFGIGGVVYTMVVYGPPAPTPYRLPGKQLCKRHCIGLRGALGL